MFGWLKRRLANRMDGFCTAARLATFGAVRREVQRREPQIEDLLASQRAAVWINYLFGESPTDGHEQILDLSAEHRAAMDWIRSDDTFQGLVVQSLRVIAVIKHTRGQREIKVGEEPQVLVEFGHRYSEAPDPDSYPDMVIAAMKTLPIEDQRAIVQSASL